MLRFFLLRVVLPLIAFLVLRAVLKSIWSSRSHSASNGPADLPKTRSGGELKKDPVCGTYVAAGVSVTKMVNGETLHFCSAACRDKYRTA